MMCHDRAQVIGGETGVKQVTVANVSRDKESTRNEDEERVAAVGEHEPYRYQTDEQPGAKRHSGRSDAYERLSRKERDRRRDQPYRRVVDRGETQRGWIIQHDQL